MKPIRSIKEINTIGLNEFVSKYKLKIATKDFGDAKLHILNYDQIESPRFNDIVDECRGIVIEEKDGHFRVVAKPFDRFYNYNEAFCVMDKFDPDAKIEVDNKLDGSLIIVYKYNGEWRVNTRGSFADREVPSGGPTWVSVVMDELGLRERLAKFSAEYNNTLVFELVGPYNQCVLKYEKPQLILLSAFSIYDNMWWAEIALTGLWGIAATLEVDTAEFQGSYFHNFQELYDNLIVKNLDSDIEGWVLKQNGRRWKYKIPKYIERHYLVSDRKAALTPKNILPIVAKNEHHELVAAYPFMKEKYGEVESLLLDALRRVDALHDKTRELSDAEFAKKFNKEPLFHAIINARKADKLPRQWFIETCVNNVQYALKMLGI